MKKCVPVLLLLFFFLLNTGFSNPQPERLVTIKGVVVSDLTGKPVSGALVYVVLGEEEALTKGKGEFSIETSHDWPIEILSEHRDYQKQSVILKAPTDKLVIRLKPRAQ